MIALNSKGFQHMLLVLGLSGSPSLRAQVEGASEGEIERPPSSEARGPEKIQVTGSRIKRINAETTAPVQIFDRETLQSTGVSSIGDFFRRSATASPLGNYSGPSVDVYAGFSTIDLLGLGASRTLVLLNGKRLPVVAGLEAVNIDNIPLALVDRIEILTGGASAVYGSDAVGGVLNIITKKSFTGTELTLFGSVPANKGGQELEFTATQGVQLSDTTQLVLTAGIRTRESIDIRDRDLAPSTTPGYDSTVYSPIPGTWSYRPGTLSADSSEIEFGRWAPSSTCPTGNQVAISPNEPDDIFCAGSRKDFFLELMPEKEEKYAAILGSMEINPSLRPQILATFHSSSNPTDFGRQQILSEDPYFLNPLLLSRDKALELDIIDARVTGDYVQVRAPLVEEPKRFYNNINDAYAVSLGLDADIGADWGLTSSLSYAKMQSRIEGYSISNRDTVFGLFVNPDDPFGADPAYNPLDPARDTAAFLGAFTDLRAKSSNDTLSLDVFADTVVTGLSGGPLTVGAGVSSNLDRFEQTPDPRDIRNAQGEPIYTGTFAESGEGERQTLSVFTEFNAPVLETLTIDGALRADQYSDFGETVNFGLGTKYSPWPWIAVRGRVASSYKAPPLTYLYKKGGGGYVPVTDEQWCARENAAGRICEDPTNFIFQDSAGNKELDPETGFNSIAGLVLEPLQGLSLISDFYWIDLEKTFRQDSPQDVLNEWYRLNSGNTTGGQIDINSVGVDADGIVTSIQTPFRNLGELQVRALSSSLNLTQKVADVDVNWVSQYFRTFRYSVKDSANSPSRNRLGLYRIQGFAVPPWRASHTLSLTWKSQKLSLYARSTAAMAQDPLAADSISLGSSVAAYNEYDVTYGTPLPWNGQLQFGVNNILDTFGGVSRANTIGSEDLISTSLYSYVGRAYFARITQSF